VGNAKTAVDEGAIETDNGDASPASLLAWGTVPTIAAALLALTIAWLTHGEFGRTAYWTSQRESFVALNLALSVWPDRVWSNLTLLGETWVLLFLLSPFIAWRPRVWAAILCAAPIAATISEIGKRMAEIPRPRAVLDQHHFVVIGHPLSAHNSFPSGHAIVAFTAAIAVLATLLPHPRGWSQWLSIFATLLIAAVICLSRVAVGAHWPLDLWAGAAAGWIAGLCGADLAHRYPQWWQRSLDSWGRYVLCVMILFASAEFVLRAIDDPYDGPVLLTSSLSGLITSSWLLGVRARLH
jgi:membrane-associated phospholipid phosphatase